MESMVGVKEEEEDDEEEGTEKESRGSEDEEVQKEEEEAWKPFVIINGCDLRKLEKILLTKLLGVTGSTESFSLFLRFPTP